MFSQLDHFCHSPGFSKCTRMAVGSNPSTALRRYLFHGFVHASLPAGSLYPASDGWSQSRRLMDGLDPSGSPRARGFAPKVYTWVENTVFRGPRSVQPARTRPMVRSGLTLPRLRRLSQALFLGLFLLLLYRTELRGSVHSGGLEFRLPYPVRAFLETDPMLAVANALATHALYRGLLWSLAILIPTLILGRFFCGWICPLGTLNHMVGNMRSGKTGRQRIASNRYKEWQTFKYYLLFALLLAAVFGSALVGILDPIALTVRSVALSILPAGHYAF